MIAPVEDFLALAKRVRRFDSNVLDLNGVTEPMTAVLKCPVQKG